MCLPGSAKTVYYKLLFSVYLSDLISSLVISPAGKPPPISRIFMSCPQSRPICMQLFANYTAFSNESAPFMPLPQ